MLTRNVGMRCSSNASYKKSSKGYSFYAALIPFFLQFSVFFRSCHTVSFWIFFLRNRCTLRQLRVRNRASKSVETFGRWLRTNPLIYFSDSGQLVTTFKSDFANLTLHLSTCLRKTSGDIFLENDFALALHWAIN